MTDPENDLPPATPILSYRRIERQKEHTPQLGTVALTMAVTSIITGLLSVHVFAGDIIAIMLGLVMLASAVLSFVLACISVTLNYQRKSAICALLLTPFLFWIFLRVSLRT